MKLGMLNNHRFQVALNKLIAQPVPLRTAFKLKGLTNKVQEELKKFEEVRQAALKQYGSKDDKGEILLNEDNTVKFEPDKLEAFAKELNDLGNADVEVGTVSLAELGDKAVLTADDVMALDGLLIE